METKKIVIILIAAAVLIVGVCIAITSSHHNGGADGQYNYSVEFQDSFVDKYGTTQHAQEGRTFAIVDITIRNDSFGPGIDTQITDPLDLLGLKLKWSLTLDRLTYSMDLAMTLAHKDYWGVVINEGRTWSYTVVFEVDEHGVGKKDLNLTYSYSLDPRPTLQYNKDLPKDPDAAL